MLVETKSFWGTGKFRNTMETIESTDEIRKIRMRTLTRGLTKNKKKMHLIKTRG